MKRNNIKDEFALDFNEEAIKELLSLDISEVIPEKFYEGFYGGGNFVVDRELRIFMYWLRVTIIELRSVPSIEYIIDNYFNNRVINALTLIKSLEEVNRDLYWLLMRNQGCTNLQYNGAPLINNEAYKYALAACKDLVYIIRSGYYFKIGFSKNVLDRIDSICQTYPEKIFILKLLEGGSELERKLHEKFKLFRLTGEWFWFCDESENMINELIGL